MAKIDELPRLVREKVKHPEALTDIFPIHCEKQQHYIAIINNSLVPLNHNFYRTMACIDLGSSRPECIEAMTNWRRPSYVVYPALMRPAHEFAHRFQSIRKYNAKRLTSELCGPKPGVCSMNDVHKEYERAFMLIRLLLLYRCDYEFLRWKPGWDLKLDWMHEARCYPSGFCDVRTITDNRLTDPAFGCIRQYATLQLELESTWLDKVWKAGVAVVLGPTGRKMLCLHHYISDSGAVDFRGTNAARLLVEKHNEIGDPYLTPADCDIYWNEGVPCVLRWHTGHPLGQKALSATA